MRSSLEQSVTLSFLTVCWLWFSTPTSTQADTFGGFDEHFTIDFVTIGNIGNGDDVDNPYPNSGDGGTSYGGVDYEFRVGVTEVPQDWITRAISLGMMNFQQGGLASQYRPTVNMDWYNAAVFVNWLNTSTGHQVAYNLTFSTNSQTWSMALWGTDEAWQMGGQNLYRHKNAYYFLPSEDEWYKAAYHKK